MNLAKTIIITESQFNYITENKTNVNKRFLKRIIKELKEFENKNNLILERGGVATFPYIDAIKNIYNYAQEYIIKNNPNVSDIAWDFDIPKYLTRGIDFIHNLNINIFVILSNENNINMGKAKGHKKIDNSISPYNKWKEGNILMHCYCNGNRILNKSEFYNILIHELNHTYQELQNALSNSSNNSIDDANILNWNAKKEFFSSDEFTDKFIKDILYYLFSSSEVNAYIAGTYGEMLSIDGERENFLKDREKLHAYKIWKYFTSNLDTLNYLTDDDWENLRDYLDVHNRSISRDSYGIESFKNRFYKKIDSCLRKYYRGIIRAAFLYYDNKDEMARENTNH